MRRIKEFGHSLRHAIRGLVYVLKYEKNFQNEVAFSLLVVVAMVYFHVTRAEMIVLFLVIMLVLIMELLNTIMERIVDILKPRVHPYAKLIKDLMAGTVLLSSILAVIIGLIIFIPYLAPKIQALMR
ncbi:MAG: diacylglycerol kinase family protein [Parcubacteria group bacterium]|jgi:undecaprenol kinase